MTDFFKDLVNNSLNKLGQSVMRTGQSFQRDWRQLAADLGGRYEQMQLDANNVRLDPRYADMVRGVEKNLGFPRVLVTHKRWTVRVMPIWFVPPPIGPLAFVRCIYSKRTDLRMSISVKRNYEFGKALQPLAKPTTSGVTHLVKMFVPEFHIPDPTPQMIEEQRLWESLDTVRSGFPEIDHAYVIRCNDAGAVKKLFADWRARESFLKIEGLQHFSLDRTAATLSQTIAGADCRPKVKIAVEFVCAVLDRMAAENFIYTDAPAFNPNEWP